MQIVAEAGQEDGPTIEEIRKLIVLCNPHRIHSLRNIAPAMTALQTAPYMTDDERALIPGSVPRPSLSLGKSSEAHAAEMRGYDDEIQRRSSEARSQALALQQRKLRADPAYQHMQRSGHYRAALDALGRAKRHVIAIDDWTASKFAWVAGWTVLFSRGTGAPRWPEREGLERALRLVRELRSLEIGDLWYLRPDLKGINAVAGASQRAEADLHELLADPGKMRRKDVSGEDFPLALRIVHLFLDVFQSAPPASVQALMAMVGRADVSLSTVSRWIDEAMEHHKTVERSSRLGDLFR